MDEAGSDTFTVKLATQPSGQVDVTVSSSDTGAATVSPASLTFTTTDWNATQEVTVSGVEDSDTDNESLTVTLSASGGDYAGKTGTVSVSVTDDDTTNAAPTFTEGFSTSRSFNETIGDTAVTTATDIGMPVSAMDPEHRRHSELQPGRRGRGQVRDHSVERSDSDQGRGEIQLRN